MLNSISLMGRIFETKEYELKQTKNGGNYVVFAIEQPYFKSKRLRDVYYIHAFNDIAERIKPFLVFGNWLVISGRIMPLGKFKFSIICEKFDCFAEKEKQVECATDLAELGIELEEEVDGWTQD